MTIVPSKTFVLDWSKTKEDFSMGSASIKKLEGFVSTGGEVPYLNPNDIKIVGVDIDETKDNWFAFCPRANDPLEDAWLADIRENGVRQPVDVYRNGDTVVMLEGRRRVRAARTVWKEQEDANVPESERITVRVNIRRGDPFTLFGYNTDSDNRKARTPLQTAILMQKAQENGADNKQIAKLFGCTGQTVKNTLKVLDLAPSLQKKVNDGEFPLREAIKLADKPREEQVKIYEELVASGATHGAAATNAISKAKQGKSIGPKDRSRMITRPILEKWRETLTSDDEYHGPHRELIVDMISLILGEGIPRNLSVFREMLESAGYKKAKKKTKEKSEDNAIESE